MTSPFDGEGARREGGRWNHPGDPVVYAAENLALAAWESFVHVDPGLAPADLVSVEAEIPDGVSSRTVAVADLPSIWRDYPAPGALQDLGTSWVRSAATLVLVVPSAVLPASRCILVNPAHPEIRRIRVEAPRPFEFDARAWKR